MNYQDISDQSIRDFLLGNLDESTTDRLDELSITDAEFAERLSVERYELIDDSVAGRLTAGEKARFEAMLARSPALAERVEIARVFAAADPKTAVVEHSPKQSFFAGLFSGWPRFAYGVAGLALLIGIVGLAAIVLRRDSGPDVAVIENTAVPSPAASTVVPPATPVNAAFPTPTEPPASVHRPDPSPTPVRKTQPVFVALVLAPPMRGSSSVKTVKIDGATEFLNLTLQTEAASSGRLMVEIGDASGNTDWKSVVIRGRSANGKTSISVRVPSARLKTGLRTVRLVDQGEVLDEHTIKIDRRP